MEGMARDIKQQKERIGGNWAVAFVANKIAREKARCRILVREDEIP